MNRRIPTRLRRYAAIFVAIALPVLPGYRPTSAAESSPNPIKRENQLPGSHDWQLTRVRADGGGFRSPWIEGYCSRQSASAGDSIDIMVSTDPPRSFRIEIFRMGYYGDRGARLMKTLGPFEG